MKPAHQTFSLVEVRKAKAPQYVLFPSLPIEDLQNRLVAEMTGSWPDIVFKLSTISKTWRLYFAKLRQVYLATKPFIGKWKMGGTTLTIKKDSTYMKVNSLGRTTEGTYRIGVKGIFHKGFDITRDAYDPSR